MLEACFRVATLYTMNKTLYAILVTLYFIGISLIITQFIKVILVRIINKMATTKMILLLLIGILGKLLYSVVVVDDDGGLTLYVFMDSSFSFDKIT